MDKCDIHVVGDKLIGYNILTVSGSHVFVQKCGDDILGGSLPKPVAGDDQEVFRAVQFDFLYFGLLRYIRFVLDVSCKEK